MKLNESKIKSYLSAANRDIKINLFETIGSTNEYLKTLPPSKESVICLAEQQTQGRGRRGKPWHSPSSKNIYFSYRFSYYKNMSELSGLTLVVALSVIHLLESLGTSDLSIKWPNDILWQGKKLSGILVETVPNTADGCQVIIGIGLNVNMSKKEVSAKSINQPWASTGDILGHIQDRNELVGRLINTLLTDLEIFEREGIDYFIEAWQHYDYLKGREITVIVGEQEANGKSVGIDASGCLLLDKGSEMLVLSGGEATVKKKNHHA